MVYPIEKIKASDIAKAVSGKIIHGSEECEITSVTTDSRTIEDNILYIPIIGERFDGHDFIDSVCGSTKAGFLCSNGYVNKSALFVIEVSDTRKALLALASYYRDMFSLKVIGLTGSVGKTTTKEFLASVVSEKYETLSTKGNLNNDIGVPLTLFGLAPRHEAAVIEMGMSNFGEIEVLSECAKPDIAVITNIGTSHIEFLKSREGILQAKCEILKGLKKDGKVILNGDDPYLWGIRGKTGFETVYVGIENKECDYVAANIKSSEEGCSFECGSVSYEVNLAGIHNVYNALVAIAAGKLLKISEDKIFAGLKNYRSDGIRQNIINTGEYKILNDCYNASPQSVIAELGVLETIKAKRRIAVLGDMAELGSEGDSLHAEVGKAVEEKNIDVLITAGDKAKIIAGNCKKTPSYCFGDANEAAEFLKGFVKKDDAILIKASRCMKFEQIADKLY